MSDEQSTGATAEVTAPDSDPDPGDGAVPPSAPTPDGSGVWTPTETLYGDERRAGLERLRRVLMAVQVAVGLGIVVAAAAVLVVGDSLVGMLVTGVVLLVLVTKLPLVVTTDWVVLTTDRAPETVERAFRGPENPLLMPVFHAADAVAVTEDATWVESGDCVGVISFEPGGLDHSPHGFQNVHDRTYLVDVRPSASGSELTGRVVSHDRMPAMKLLTGAVAWRYHRRWLEGAGYAVKESRSSLSLTHSGAEAVPEPVAGPPDRDRRRG